MKLTFLVFALVCSEIKCICRQSFVTLCDDLEDLTNYNVENWTELVVGDENADSSKLRSVDFHSLSLDRFYKLISLTVVRQINDVQPTIFRLDAIDYKLEYVKWYGNEIKRIRFGTFDAMILRKLALSNNSIEYIHKGAFYNCEIKTIDLSDNMLEIIERGVFNEGVLRNKTKEMIFTNNKLGVVQTDSLPSSLEILNLDYNKIDTLHYTVFENLINLQELTLSHNKMRSLPNMKNLSNIITMDFSHNFITYIHSTNFNALSRLEVLDLSHNKIFVPVVFRQFNFPQRHPSLQISLAFNRLTHLVIEGDSFRNHIVLLYGNPWNCECWAFLEKFMADNQVKRNDCDFKFFGNGEIPYCINYSPFNCNETMAKPLTEIDKSAGKFLEIIKKTESIVGCRLAPRRL